jgi:hypothetical protein
MQGRRGERGRARQAGADQLAAARVEQVAHPAPARPVHARATMLDLVDRAVGDAQARGGLGGSSEGAWRIADVRLPFFASVAPWAGGSRGRRAARACGGWANSMSREPPTRCRHRSRRPTRAGRRTGARRDRRCGPRPIRRGPGAAPAGVRSWPPRRRRGSLPESSAPRPRSRERSSNARSSDPRLELGRAAAEARRPSAGRARQDVARGGRRSRRDGARAPDADRAVHGLRPDLGGGGGGGLRRGRPGRPGRPAPRP